MTDKRNDPARNEGEGSRSAARAYNKDTRDFVKSGRVDQAARDARDSLDGPEGADLRKAEEKGRAKAKEFDPNIKR